MSATGIVEMASRQWRRPVAECLREATPREVLAHLIQRKVGKPESGEGGVEDQVDGIEDEWRVHADAHLASILEKSPSVQRA
jgi:hypothetical protein